MSEVLENIKSRRSVRSYTTEQITKEQLDDILTAGMYAPSARNSQNWQLTVIQKADQLDRLDEAISKVLSMKYHHFYGAPTLILVSTPRDFPQGAFDSSVVLQNIFLAAHEVGAGAVWINQINGNSDHEALRPLLTEFGVPDDHLVWGCSTLGIPATLPIKSRKNKGTIVFA